ncbi:hypothetical protein GGR53DRAFT_524793 [Hypoxylon sp. FL1150]|nr:hypothetical protein GGR53DRAFT_524793 [Hypoxylon sp. FL1150]
MAKDKPELSPQAKTVAATVTTGTDDHCASHRRDCPFQDRPRLRWAFLVSFVLLVVAVLVVGIVFSVYYNAVHYTNGVKQQINGENTGGVRAEADTEGGAPPREMLLLDRGAADDESSCGEGMDSCRAYNQPNICCPVDMICHSTNLTLSGIYCCAKDSPCLATSEKPPRCDDHAHACNKSVGGGCCAVGTECAAGGCLETYRAAPGFAPSLLSGTQKPPPTRTYTQSTETQEGVTVTTPRIGETAQSSDGVRGVEPRFGFSSCPKLELVALGTALVVTYAMVLRG